MMIAIMPNKAPKASKKKRANAILHMRCRPDHKQRWQDAAEGQDLELAAWIRQVLNQAAREPAKSPYPGAE